MGLEPGPLDKFLGWDSKRVLEPWDSTFRVAGTFFSVKEEFAREIVLHDFGQTPSPRAEEPAFEENAAITVAEGPAPAQGELSEHLEPGMDGNVCLEHKWGLFYNSCKSITVARCT